MTRKLVIAGGIALAGVLLAVYLRHRRRQHVKRALWFVADRARQLVIAATAARL